MGRPTRPDHSVTRRITVSGVVFLALVRLLGNLPTSLPAVLPAGGARPERPDGVEIYNRPWRGSLTYVKCQILHREDGVVYRKEPFSLHRDRPYPMRTNAGPKSRVWRGFSVPVNVMRTDAIWINSVSSMRSNRDPQSQLSVVSGPRNQPVRKAL